MRQTPGGLEVLALPPAPRSLCSAAYSLGVGKVVGDGRAEVSSLRRENNQLLAILSAVIRKYGEVTGSKNFRVELNEADLVYSPTDLPDITLVSGNGIALDQVSIVVKGDR